MKFFIDSNALERLTDPKLETRQNALKEITSIMKNNILIERKYNPYAQEEIGVVNLEVLTRQLILWFQFKPITNEAEVFNLLIIIFSREDFLRQVTKTLSLQRLKKEVSKIKKLLIPEESSMKLQKIEELLSKFEHGVLVDVANETGSFVEITSNYVPSEASNNSFIDRMQKLAMSPTRSSGLKCNDDEENENFNNEFWVNLDGKNLEAFQFIDSELLMFKNEKRLRNILKYLSVTISDYPAEFFIQSPNVLETLIDIIPKIAKVNKIEILQLIHFIVNGLKGRYNEAAKQKMQYFPIKRHMNKIIQMFTNFFESFHDNFEEIDLECHQEIFNPIYLILFDMVDLVENTQYVCDIYLNELLNMLAKVARDFRMGYANTNSNGIHYRLNYIVGIYLINAFVSRIDVENITKYNENNLWEYECDLALLDWTLSYSHKQVYNLIKRNRSSMISDDNDMMLLLNVEATWKPVVELFQNWEKLTDENIIYRGLKCLETIRIHKSLELVELLFKTIAKCSEKFNTMNRLRKAAEEIVLRLLSIDISEIRMKAYTIARNYVQKKMTDDQDEKLKNTHLSVIIGIPITTEIVTQILCFGYCDENEEIYKHAKLILFALLRAKVVYPNHWGLVFEVMRPVLPLVSCLFATDQKLGFFAFDIFHQNSGFDENELNQAFVRFMYCSHPKARELAKIKLLESLNVVEFTNDFIEMVPDNFCIVPDIQVSDLQIPQSSISYDKESYETVKNLLPTIDRDDAEILKSVLLQFSIQMNSLKVCHKSHDDHLWVFFMADLNIGHPNNLVIRKLTINILYKWAVTIQSFRIYLATEPKVLEFLIKTLIYYQEDDQIKLQASSLLFLLAFSDFAVTTEKTISLPKFLKYLKYPFKFEEHWTESPFNKITQLEWLYDALEVENENMDVQEITKCYLRFTFGSVWFNKTPGQIMASKLDRDVYYKHLSDNALKVNDKLMLTEKDNKIKRDTSLSYITSYACKALETTTIIQELLRLIFKIDCSLMIPNMFISTFADDLGKRIKRFTQSNEKQSEHQKYVHIKCLQLYQKITPWMTENQIVEALDREEFKTVFGKNTVPDDIYIQILKFINAVVSICKERKGLTEQIIKHFNATQKIHFSSQLFEKLCQNLFDVRLENKKWNEYEKIPTLKTIFTLLRNVLSIMPIELDEKYLNKIFNKFVKISREFLKTKKENIKTSEGCVKTEFIDTHIINQIFGIIDVLTSLKYNFILDNNHHTIIFLWIKESDKVDKALIWSIIGNITRKKDCFDKFCKGFKDELGFPLVDMVFQRIFSENVTSLYEQKALALIIGNLLDHATINNELNCSTDKLELQMIYKILDQKQLNYDILSFLIKKMIQNKVPEVTKIVKEKSIIQKVLYSTIENLDMITMCHLYDDLKEHVYETVASISDNRLIELIENLQNATNFEALKEMKSEKYKKINHNVLNIILILTSSSIGLKNFRRVLQIPNFLELFVMALYSGLKTINPSNEIIFHLKFLNSLLNAYVLTKSDISTSCFGSYEPEIKYSKKFLKISEEFEENLKPENAIFESNFHRILYASDLFLLQALKIFNFSQYSKHSNHCKYEMKLSSFVFIRNLLEQSSRSQTFANEIGLQEWIVEKARNFINNPINIPVVSYTEATKKQGVQKCQMIAKNLGIFLKAISEWNLPHMKNPTKLKELFDDFKKLYSWFENDSMLYNCFLQFIQHISSLSIAKSCLMQEVNGTQLMKAIIKKTQTVSSKTPHTEGNLILLQNGLLTIEKCSFMVEVRLILKNMKIFQILDLLHPQIQANKKITWNEVSIMWLEFFEILSRYEDSECTPGQISLLCRIVRIGNQKMKLSCLKIIRNLSMKSSLGHVAIISDEFMQTIDSILLEDGGNQEKLLILQTLLCIASKSEQSRSKLKNSSFNRKLKEHLISMEHVLNHSNNSEIIELFKLTSMLKDILYA